MSDPKPMFWFNHTPDYNEQAHNEGQVDGARGEYNNRYERPGDALMGGPHDPEERGLSYREGYENGRNNPSSDDSEESDDK
jgi:hypothetical protein